MSKTPTKRKVQTNSQDLPPVREPSKSYKLILFQTLPSILKNQCQIQLSFLPLIDNFLTMIKAQASLSMIFCKLIEDSLQFNSHNAVFLADKLLSLTSNHPVAVYLMGESLFIKEEYIKVSYLFHKHGLTTENENYIVLAAKALIKIGQTEQAQRILTSPIISPLGDKGLESELAFLTAKCQHLLDNRKEAEENYLKALQLNPGNFAAFEGQCETRQGDEENTWEVIQELPFDKDQLWMRKFYEVQAFMTQRLTKKNGEDRYAPSIDYLSKSRINTRIYETPIEEISFGGSGSKPKISKTDKISDNSNLIGQLGLIRHKSAQAKKLTGMIVEPSPGNSGMVIEKTAGNPKQGKEHVDDHEKEAELVMNRLWESENIHLMYLRAKNSFSNFQINSAFEICKTILEHDFFHFETLLLYSELLVEKNAISELFSCSTTLAENYPEHYVTFHMFGMYYFLLKKFETARKYFNKGIQINKDSLVSFLMLGHSFANQEESEQAMNVYRSCIRLFPNSHLPHIYIGMEYLRINNLKTAMLSFNQAKKIAGPNPIVYNEIGCIHLKEKKYAEAKKAFNKALKNCKADGINWLQHIVLNNLGNAHRKFKEYKSAVECYERSLSLCPNDPAVTFSLAFCYHLIGNLNKAIALYHKVVTIKYDSHFVNQMLITCLGDLADKNFELFK